MVQPVHSYYDILRFSDSNCFQAYQNLRMGVSPKAIARFFKERLTRRLIKHLSAYERPLALGCVG